MRRLQQVLGRKHQRNLHVCAKPWPIYSLFSCSHQIWLLLCSAGNIHSSSNIWTKDCNLCSTIVCRWWSMCSLFPGTSVLNLGRVDSYATRPSPPRPPLSLSLSLMASNTFYIISIITPNPFFLPWFHPSFLLLPWFLLPHDFFSSQLFNESPSPKSQSKNPSQWCFDKNPFPCSFNLPSTYFFNLPFSKSHTQPELAESGVKSKF